MQKKRSLNRLMGPAAAGLAAAMAISFWSLGAAAQPFPPSQPQQPPQQSQKPPSAPQPAPRTRLVDLGGNIGRLSLKIEGSVLKTEDVSCVFDIVDHDPTAEQEDTIYKNAANGKGASACLQGDKVTSQTRTNEDGDYTVTRTFKPHDIVIARDNLMVDADSNEKYCITMAKNVANDILMNPDFVRAPILKMGLSHVTIRLDENSAGVIPDSRLTPKPQLVGSELILPVLHEKGGACDWVQATELSQYLVAQVSKFQVNNDFNEAFGPYMQSQSPGSISDAPRDSLHGGSGGPSDLSGITVNGNIPK